jgi:hypothetical protein
VPSDSCYLSDLLQPGISAGDTCVALAIDLVDYYTGKGGNADFMLPAFVQILSEGHPDLAAIMLTKFDVVIMEMTDVNR